IVDLPFNLRFLDVCPVYNFLRRGLYLYLVFQKLLFHSLITFFPCLQYLTFTFCLFICMSHVFNITFLLHPVVVFPHWFLIFSVCFLLSSLLLHIFCAFSVIFNFLLVLQHILFIFDIQVDLLLSSFLIHFNSHCL